MGGSSWTRGCNLGSKHPKGMRSSKDTPKNWSFLSRSWNLVIYVIACAQNYLRTGRWRGRKNRLSGALQDRMGRCCVCGQRCEAEQAVQGQGGNADFVCSRKQTISRGLLISAISGTHNDCSLRENLISSQRGQSVLSLSGFLEHLGAVRKKPIIQQQSQGRSKNNNCHTSQSKIVSSLLGRWGRKEVHDVCGTTGVIPRQREPVAMVPLLSRRFVSVLSHTRIQLSLGGRSGQKCFRPLCTTYLLSLSVLFLYIFYGDLIVGLIWFFLIDRDSIIHLNRTVTQQQKLSGVFSGGWGGGN